MKYRYLLLFSFTLFLLNGCNPSSQDSKAPKPASVPNLKNEPAAVDSKAEGSDALIFSNANANANANVIVASVGSETIRSDELDRAIQLALFDLEWRKYELRKSMLSNMITQRQRLSADTLASEVFLTPPDAPRLDLPTDKRPIKGNPDAPVVLSVFCSFQSSHCARLQPIIKQLDVHYGESLGFRFYDLPQGFHRYAKGAANAAHCATELGKPWAYMDALYADITTLDKPRFLVIAEQLGLDRGRFETCLDERRYMSRIKADVEFASQLGLGNVPVVFINGLYTKGPQTFDAYRYYVDQELARVGVVAAVAEQSLVESKLPVALIATTVSNDARQSTALITLQGSEQGSLYKVGESLSDQITVVNIEQERVIINNSGQLEFIKLQASTGYGAAKVSDPSPDQGLGSQAPGLDEINPLGEKYRPAGEEEKRELPPTGEMTLSKEWLQDQLADRAKLQKYFYNADHVADGYHLVKLNNIDNQRFYTTLGLKTGDVLLRVNDQWVHEGQNPLWESLENEAKVSVTLMRKGFPVRYDYTIK